MRYVVQARGESRVSRGAHTVTTHTVTTHTDGAEERGSRRQAAAALTRADPPPASTRVTGGAAGLRSSSNGHSSRGSRADESSLNAPSKSRAVSALRANGARVRAVIERRDGQVSDECRVVACVEMETLVDGKTEDVPFDAIWSLAIRRMQRCIRPGDRMCILDRSRIALCMGHGSDAVPPAVLGRRLARALGDHLSVRSAEVDLRVVVGVGTAPRDTAPDVLASAAMASIRATRGPRSALPENCRKPFVAVTHLRGDRSRAGLIARRYLVPVVDDDSVDEGPGSKGTDENPTSHDRVVSLGDRAVRVLVVDPAPEPKSASSPLVDAAVATLEASGFVAATARSDDAESLLLELKVAEPDTAVVVLKTESLRLPGESARSWEVAAQLTRVLRDERVPVVALSMGASVAALAACVEHGASAAFSPESLPSEIARVVKYSPAAGGNGEPPAPGHLPPPYDALVHLTTSERRVLFHMMDGRSAAEIASTLVVSVTTVRSHIRSILHKLNVNSQLAAVALAFGTMLEHASAG